MARRAPDDEKPFRPLDVSILSSVVQHAPEEIRATAPTEPARKVIDLPAHPTSLRPIPQPLPTIAPAASAVPSMYRLEQERRILFTREECQALDRMIINMAVRLRTQVKVSHVFRALTMLLLHAETQIDQRAGERGTLVRPSNGDLAALHQFDREIAQILAHALRDAGPPR
jgi:hypothetical protein